MTKEKELIVCPYEEVNIETIPGYRFDGLCPICHGKYTNHLPIAIDILNCTDTETRRLREILLSLTKDY